MTLPFTFAHPHLLWLLALMVPAGLAMVVGSRNARARLQRLVPDRLRAVLVRGSTPWLRHLRNALAIAALAMAALAAAGPLIGEAPEEVRQTGRDVILAVDVSKSMLAPDLTPNRLTRVRLAAQDLVSELKGDRIGIVAFAGRAFLQAPLTLDSNAAIRSIVTLEPAIIPLGGTNIAEAIEIAREAFGDNEAPNRVLVIFSDGEDLAEEAEEAARAAAENGIRIFTVGVGTPEGSLVTLPRELGFSGDFIRDERGTPVRSQLDEARLKRLAQIGGGTYVRLGAVDGLDPLIKAVAGISGNSTLSETRLAPLNRFQYPLGMALILLLLGWLLPERRPERPVRGGTSHARKIHSRTPLTVPAWTVAACLFSASFAHGRAETAGTDQTPTPAAPKGSPLDLYEDGRFDEALEAFKSMETSTAGSVDAFNTGCAAYKVGDFQTAIEAFANTLKSSDPELLESAHYNLGNTLAKLGQQRMTPPDGARMAADAPTRTLEDWRSALQHYDAALERNPDSKNARENRELIRKLIESLEQQQQQPQQQQQDGEQQQDQQQQQGAQQQQQQQGGQQEQQQQQGGQQQQDQQGQGNPQNEQQNAQQQDGDPSSDGQGQTPDADSGDDRNANNASRGNTEQQPLPDVQPREHEGEIRGADGTPQDGRTQESSQSAEAQAGEGETNEDAQMTRAQAARLLEALRAEEDRVLLHERTRPERVYKDW